MPEEVNLVFVERLKKLRGKVSRAKFARQAGISPNTYYRYETGTRLPDINVLSRIADHANVTPGWLLGKEDDAPAARPEPTAGADIKDITIADLSKLAVLQAEKELTQSKLAVVQAEKDLTHGKLVVA